MKIFQNRNLFMKHQCKKWWVSSNYLSFYFFGIYYLITKNNVRLFLISFSMFIVGFIDDLKIRVKPSKRLFFMVFILFLLIYFLPIEIFNIDIPVLKYLMNSHLFSTIFVLLCFLFVINGANLIDGFNGLLTLNILIINIILVFINTQSDNLDFSFFLTAQIIVLLSFLLFNFPRAKIFWEIAGPIYLDPWLL